MVDRIKVREGFTTISATAEIMPVKRRNGNLQDKQFHREFKKEEEEIKKKRRKENIFRTTEIAKIEKSKQDIATQRDSHEHQNHTGKRPCDSGLRRRIDVIV